MSKILVIQDEELDQDGLLRRLIRRGFTAPAFAEVEKGLAHARKENPELILLDMNLSDMDGWEAARRFKDDAATKAVPIIALSNEELVGAEAMALDAGCIDFAPRPVDFNSLLDKIQKAMAAPRD